MERVIPILTFVILLESIRGCNVPGNKCINGTCRLQSGNQVCSLGCVDGYTGTFCQERCRNRCQACFQDNPDTCTKCEIGRYGGRCEHKCPNCFGNTCHINGTCTDHCVSSFWGPKCDISCPRHCNDCHGVRCKTCNVFSGECLSGCEKGFTGLQCEDKVSCPEDCLECNHLGICTTCKTGYHGETCTSQCTECLGGACDQNGECVDGCGEGYHGSDCKSRRTLSDRLPVDSQTSTWDDVITLFQSHDLLLPFLCSSFVLCIVVTGLVAWRCGRRKRRMAEHGHESSTTASEGVTEYPIESNSINNYDEIDQPRDMLQGRPVQPLPGQDENNPSGVVAGSQDGYLTGVHHV